MRIHLLNDDSFDDDIAKTTYLRLNELGSIAVVMNDWVGARLHLNGKNGEIVKYEFKGIGAPIGVCKVFFAAIQQAMDEFEYRFDESGHYKDNSRKELCELLGISGGDLSLEDILSHVQEEYDNGKLELNEYGNTKLRLIKALIEFEMQPAAIQDAFCKKALEIGDTMYGRSVAACFFSLGCLGMCDMAEEFPLFGTCPAPGREDSTVSDMEDFRNKYHQS